MIRLTILLLLFGCSIDSTESDSETKEVAWIYYGSKNQVLMTGCFWTQDFAPRMDWIDEAGIGHGYLETKLLHCINYGEKTHIRHNLDYKSFSIHAEGFIYEQDYDSLEFKYK